MEYAIADDDKDRVVVNTHTGTFKRFTGDDAQAEECIKSIMQNGADEYGFNMSTSDRKGIRL